mmetsp:Transcript_15331/g.22595  ORF Transcript_15331/g.22595 Transcript_15331/m.22595 type:complete len:934 (+) Transcript_15331:114-2915(+)
MKKMKRQRSDTSSASTTSSDAEAVAENRIKNAAAPQAHNRHRDHNDRESTEGVVPFMTSPSVSDTSYNQSTAVAYAAAAAAAAAHAAQAAAAAQAASEAATAAANACASYCPFMSSSSTHRLGTTSDRTLNQNHQQELSSTSSLSSSSSKSMTTSQAANSHFTLINGSSSAASASIISANGNYSGGSHYARAMLRPYGAREKEEDDENAMPALISNRRKQSSAVGATTQQKMEYSNNDLSDDAMPPLVTDGTTATKGAKNIKSNCTRKRISSATINRNYKIKNTRSARKKVRSSSSPLTSLPDELLHGIVSFANASSLCSLDASCKQMYELTPPHWKKISNRRFGHLCRFSKEYIESSHSGKVAWSAGMSLIRKEGRVYIPFDEVAPTGAMSGAIHHGFSGGNDGERNGYSRFVAFGSDDHSPGDQVNIDSEQVGLKSAEINDLYPNITIDGNDQEGRRAMKPISIRDMNSSFQPVGCIDGVVGAWSLAIVGKEGEEIVVNSMGSDFLHARRLFSRNLTNNINEQDCEEKKTKDGSGRRRVNNKMIKNDEQQESTPGATKATRTKKQQKNLKQQALPLTTRIDFREHDINEPPELFDGSRTEGIQILATPSVLLVSRQGMFHLFIPDDLHVLKRVHVYNAGCTNVVDLKWTASEYGERCFACCTDPGVVKVWQIMQNDNVENEDVRSVTSLSFSAVSGLVAPEVTAASSTVSRETKKEDKHEQHPYSIVHVKTVRTDHQEYFNSFDINHRFLAASRGRTLITVYDVVSGRALHNLREPESEYMEEDDNEGEAVVGGNENANNNGGGGGGNNVEDEDDFTHPLSMYSQGEILVTSSMLGAAICIWDMSNGTLLCRHSDIFRRDGYDNWLASQDELPDGNDVTCLSPIWGGNGLLLSVFGGYSYLFGFPANEVQRKKFDRIRMREMDVIRKKRRC